MIGNATNGKWNRCEHKTFRSKGRDIVHSFRRKSSGKVHKAPNTLELAYRAFSGSQQPSQRIKNVPSEVAKVAL